jgi:hypothetical protein
MVGTAMFRHIRAVLARRHATIVEAEELVRFGSRGVDMARTFSRDQSVAEDRREHYRRVKPSNLNPP